METVDHGSSAGLGRQRPARVSDSRGATTVAHTRGVWRTGVAVQNLDGDILAGGRIALELYQNAHGGGRRPPVPEPRIEGMLTRHSS